jgi:hypothetical protein
MFSEMNKQEDQPERLFDVSSTLTEYRGLQGIE